jgi:hypothetical protein
MEPIDSSSSSYGTSGDRAYIRAHKRAEDLQGLYIHVLVYIVVNLGLFALNWLQRGDGGGWWFQWATLGWGIGLLIHVLVIAAPVFSDDWTDRKAERLLHR